MRCDHLIADGRMAAYVDGTLPKGDLPAVEAHLSECGSCRATAAAHRSMNEGISRLSGTVGPDFQSTLFARLESEGLLPARVRWWEIPSFRFALIPSMAALALLAFVVMSRGPVGVVPAGPATNVATIEAPASFATSEGISPEDAEIVALMEVLEAPVLPDDPNPLFDESGALPGASVSASST